MNSTFSESEPKGPKLEEPSLRNIDDYEKGTVQTSSQNDISDAFAIVGWDSPNDPENPLNWPFWLRWTMICLTSALTFMAGLSSSMFAPSIPALLEDFNSPSTILGSLVVTIFVLGLATGPLFFAPLSEMYGRSSVQHVGCVGYAKPPNSPASFVHLIE